MKQVFYWLRNEIENHSVKCGGANIIGMHKVRSLINQAENNMAVTEAEIRAKAIDEFAKWCYINGIDFSYMAKYMDNEPFVVSVLKRFEAEQLKE